MLDWILAVLALGLLIILHESGHMVVARLCGMRVERFSVGFGKAIVSWRRGETTYQIAVVPFGGFVQIAGMNPLEPVHDEDAGSYANKSVLRRAATIFAGPLANYLLAILGFFLLAAGPGVGRPYASMVQHGSPAARAGLLPGDVLLTVDGQPVRTNDDVVQAIQAAGGAPVRLVVRRSEPFWTPLFRARGLPQPDWPEVAMTEVASEQTFMVQPRHAEPLWMLWAIALVPEPVATASPRMLRWIRPANPTPPAHPISAAEEERLLTWLDTYRPQTGPYRVGIGIGAADWDRERMPLSAALADSIKMPIAVSAMILASLGQLITGHVSTNDLSGPVGIARVIKQQFDLGLGQALSTLALLNVYLGLFNLLPWPALDGGRLVFLGYEAATRRRANARVEQTVHAVGFALLLAMLLLVTAKDIIHLGG